jgi:hypothetical protein
MYPPRIAHGASLVEWVVVVVVIVGLLGAAALWIASTAQGRAGSLETWINTVASP